MRSSEASKLTVLMATAFIDMIGGLMVVPLLPFYAKDLGANGFMIGVLVSAFWAAQLISAPFWGRVSDKYGRKPTLLMGLCFSVVAYIIFAFSMSFWLLLLSRVVQGAGGGTVGVIQAYVTDSVKPENRARALGWLSAATNTGVFIGPMIGSWATTVSVSTPGLLAAGLCILNMIFVWTYLGESHGAAARGRTRTARPVREALKQVLLNPREPSSRLIWIYSFAIGAYYGVNPILILFLGQRYGVTESTVGYFWAYMGALNVIFRILMIGPAVDRMGEARTSRLGAGLLAAGLAIIPLTYPVPIRHFSFLALALAIGLLPLGATFTFPSVTALLSRVVGENERGMYMGVQQTYGGVLRVFFPLWAGWAYDHSGFGLAFWTSAACVAFTTTLSAGLQSFVKPRMPTGEHAIVDGAGAAGAQPVTSAKTTG